MRAGNGRTEEPSASNGAGTRPGGRAARVVGAVLRATVSELARVGFDLLRIDDVAEAAQVNKTTVYRRWPSKIDLVAAAIHAAGERMAFTPDTGSVRGDLLALLDAHAAKSRSVELRSLSRAFLGEIPPELRRLVLSLRAEYRGRWDGAVRRGIARGELPAETRVELVTELLTSISTLRHLRNDPALSTDARAAVVDLVLAGASAPAPWAKGRGRPSRGAPAPSTYERARESGGHLRARARSARPAAGAKAT